MLVVTRKQDEQIAIGDDIVVTIVRISGGSVKVGIEAPQDRRIRRVLSGAARQWWGEQLHDFVPGRVGEVCYHRLSDGIICSAGSGAEIHQDSL